ncbi:hypothetical protein, partial [Terrisporobacter sp.]
EVGNNEKYGLGELYINKEEFTNGDDILITFNFDKNEDNKFLTRKGSATIRDKKVIGKTIATSDFSYFKNKEIYVTEPDASNDNMINNKTHIANITCKDTNEDAKVYLEIVEMV